MYTARETPVFWEEYISSLLSSSGRRANDSGIRGLQALGRGNLAPVGRLLAQLQINGLLGEVSEPPVPLPAPSRCGRNGCPLGWLKNVYVVDDPTIQTAALSFRRQNAGGAAFEFLIRVNSAALPFGRKYLNMVVAHEIAHLLFIQEHGTGGLIQYLNLTHSPGKAKAEWLVHELAREVVAPTRLLTRRLVTSPHQHPALKELAVTGQMFIIPERELVGALLHSNAYLSWLRIRPEVRTWVVKNPHLSHLNLEFMRGHTPLALLLWAKSLVVILDFTRGGAVKARRYVGKLWGQAPGFIPGDSYQIPKRARAGLDIDKLIAQCSEWLGLANPKQQDRTLSMLLYAPVDKKPILDKCPELWALMKRWSRRYMIEVAVRKIALGHRAYILIRPHQPNQGFLLGEPTGVSLAPPADQGTD